MAEAAEISGGVSTAPGIGQFLKICDHDYGIYSNQRAYKRHLFQYLPLPVTPSPQ